MANHRDQFDTNGRSGKIGYQYRLIGSDEKGIDLDQTYTSEPMARWDKKSALWCFPRLKRVANNLEWNFP